LTQSFNWRLNSSTDAKRLVGTKAYHFMAKVFSWCLECLVDMKFLIGAQSAYLVPKPIF